MALSLITAIWIPEFYVKHQNIYVFVELDVVEKIKQIAYVSTNSISQQTRQSKYEQQKTVCGVCLSHTAY